MRLNRSLWMRRVDGHIGAIRATGLPLRDFSLLLGSGNLIRRSRFLGQLLQQCPGLPQVFRVEALGEPAIDLRELRAGFLFLALTLAQAAQAHRRPQLKKPRPLAARDVEGLLKARLGLCLRFGTWGSRL
jgi:hypothetical protein